LIHLIWAGLLLAEGDFAAAADLVAPYLDGAAPATPQERIAALLVAAVAHRRLGAAGEAAAWGSRPSRWPSPSGRTGCSSTGARPSGRR
jgi:hypothetical protein